MIKTKPYETVANLPTDYPDENDIAFAENQNKLFPVFLKAECLRLLIVGGGKEGTEKMNTVLKNSPEASIRMVAPEIINEAILLSEWYPNVSLKKKPYSKSDLNDVDWVIIADNDPDLEEQVRQDAHGLNLLVNVADKPGMCDYYLGAIVQKGHLKIAISTNGKSPTVAKKFKDVLQSSVPDELNNVLDNMGRIHHRLNGNFSSRLNKLNKLTSGLADDSKEISIIPERKWKRIVYGCIIAFFLMFAGHAILSLIPLREIFDGGIAWASGLDKTFYFMILAGFLAQLVDGALGMGYGVTCTSVLLGIGVPLPAISGSIHTAEMFSSGASGLSHYKFGNINKKLFRLILIPGIVGAVAGAFLLSWLGNEYANYLKPLLACYTLILGARILLNAFKKNKVKKQVKRVGWLAAAGGFLDSFGGGGWGPLVTSTLISKGKTPRYVIGTVSITEFFVTLASAITFFTMIGISHWQVILGLIIGGVTAAPIAAKLSGKLPVKTMFIAVGTLVVIWSLNILIKLIFFS